MFDEVIVQKESARPVSCVHSFAMWRAPLRADDADADGVPARARAISEATVTATTRMRFARGSIASPFRLSRSVVTYDRRQRRTLLQSRLGDFFLDQAEVAADVEPEMPREEPGHPLDVKRSVGLV